MIEDDYIKSTTGYRVHRTDSGRYEHRDVWEAAHGKIPLDHQIHHKNRIKTDNRLENLECLSRTDHMRLHGLTPEKVKHMRKVRRLKNQRSYRCGQCDKLSITFHHTQRFCCSACKRKWHNDEMGQKRAEARSFSRGESQCPICKTVFSLKILGQIYCSNRCLGVATGRRYCLRKGHKPSPNKYHAV